MGRIPPGTWKGVPGEFLKVGNWLKKRKTVILLCNSKRIIKVTSDKVSKKKKGRRQTRCPGRDDAQ
jgi:hypothetical protein